MIHKILNRWSDFWFAPVPLLNLAVFRILLCTTMAWMYLHRQMGVKLFYMEEGLLPRAMALKSLPEGMRPAFLLSVWPDAWTPWMHAALVLILILMALGIAGRVLGAVAIYLQLSFLFRNYGVVFGADQIGTLLLGYLVLTKSNARLSVLNWWKKRSGKIVEAPEFSSDLLTSVFYRMIQIQLCIVYFYSGVEKLKGASWWDGTALWAVFANSQSVTMDFTWLRHFPLLIVAVSFTTLLFEIYFPVLVWIRPVKKYVLGFGVLFHAGIALVLFLWSFGLVMVSPYVLFLPKETVDQAFFRLQKRLQRLS